MRRLIVIAGILLGILLLVAATCSGPATIPGPQPVRLEYTCGTTAVPPIAAAASKCTAARGSTKVTGGHRWYSAPADDVDEPKERPKIGKPLHGDWWNPVEQADD
jgi:hypothetical protein